MSTRGDGGMTLARHLPPGASPEEVVAAVNQVRDQLAAQADADDDPTTRREDVHVVVEPAPDGEGGGLAVRGFLDAVPTAPYLEPGFDPYAGVPPHLAAQARDDRPLTTPVVGPQGPVTAPRAFSGPTTPESASTTGGDE